MKTTKILAMMVAVVLITAWSHMVFAEEKSITLPVGTKAEKLGPGHFKFKLPDGQTVEVKGYSKRSGATAMIGDTGIFDRSGKPIASGKQGSLKSGPKPTEDKHLKINKGYIQIDDDITWLPATITFKLIGIANPDPPPRPLDQTKTKGLSPQPDPPGKK